ncbi:MYB binding protein 1a [Ictidomys tridecemlineatus]|uniref:myb-binding protein 1A n=1 Tax=Ictidomys tridecemlineatus TaxID=43179 RepID=UPI00038C1C55|nr:myb-binding protein 1A [Ictidomys tridecemlineatus]KAG3270132.1 MYB binding protein 1a [Ictidomys tridecemlineatus]
MAEIKSCDVAEPVSTQDATQADRHGLLEHSREFLDFFWDIAKPHQETRLEATEKLLDYLRTRPTGSEMKYALKRLITGLGTGRETARPCFSLALAQLLQSFEDIPLCSILQQIQEKYDLEKVKKAMMRSALFANLFGVLALFQSGRLVKDQEALLKSVKLLQTLAQHYNHLHSQPLKALMDILSEVPEATFQEILPEVITGDLNVVLSSPHHLELFLLAQQKVPTKLKKLMGSVDLLSDENIPSLVNVLKMVATSVKKEHKLPGLALNLLRLALKEDRFSRFWKEVVEQGLLKKQSWPACYLCFRLLGAALPLLSTEQLQLVMQGDLIRLFGEHTVTTKLPNQFKFVPEMSVYIGTFLEGSQDDPERQLAVLVAFSSITEQGLPVMPTFWRVTQFLNPQALQDYVAWLQDMFLKPNLDSLIEFSTTNQKKSQDASLNMPERAVYRLRKWIIHRMVNIVDQLYQEKEEALIDQVARFCLFHSFFKTKNPVDQIPETKQQLSIPLDVRTRDFIITAFFSLLQTLSIKFKQAPDQTQGGKSWTYHLVQLADTLLNHSGNVDAVTPFTTEQRQAWDQMLETLKELEARSSEAKATAFQHLLLLVGIHLFKSPTESCDLLGDIQTCIKKSMGEKSRRRSRAKATDSQEPPWVEVMVEILLSLLAQPSHLMRQVARNVFGHICPHLTPRALQLVLDVLNPETNQDEDDNVVVTDDSDEKQLMDSENENKDSEDNRNSESEEDSEDGEESEEEERDEDVDPGFRQQLMAVLHAGKALGGVDGEEDEEELGDEAMMALDQNLASLFAEQKLRIQARKDEKNKQQKEKALRVAFQIRVLDLIEVLVTKQPENPLVLELLEPLLSIIRRSMRSSSTARQEQDLLHKTARIFMQHLCRARRYCHDLGDRVEALHTRVEQLVQQASRQADSSVALYYFNASLYLLRVLKGNTVKKVIHKSQKQKRASTNISSEPQEPQAASCLDLNLVTSIYSGALSSFLTKRNSPLTAAMFLNLFSRFPVICKNLLPILIQHVAGPARPRHQVQACLLLQKTLPRGELRPCFEESEWEQLIVQILVKVTENLRTLGEAQNKSEHQKELSSLGLLNILLKNHKRRAGNLTTLLDVLQGRQQILQQSLQQGEHLIGSTRLHDLYWQALKMLGVQRPKLEKKDAKEVSSATQSPVSMKRKKKGFLPETKKRKKRKSEDVTAIATGEDQPPSTGKRRRKKIKAKTSKLQNRSEKLSQVNGVTPTSPAEPAGKKQRQKALPKKEVSGKSPQSALPRKKARLSLVRSPSLFQGGAKRKRMMRKKGRAAQTPTCPSSPATRSPVDS